MIYAPSIVRVDCSTLHVPLKAPFTIASGSTCATLPLR